MYPGYEVTSQVVTPTSQTLVGSDNGMDFYEVEWDLSPIILEGRSDYTTRYWVGISATTTNGSTPFWEVTTDDMIGQPAMYSTGSWFAMYHFSQDGTYIFYAECEPLDPGGGTNDCGSEIANGGFVEGIACNEANSEIAANDIVVPADSNLTLNGIMANMILEEGETITSAKIWIFADEFGYPYMYPGYEVTSQVVTSTSQTLVGSDNGMDFYEVEWDLSPIILEGRSDYTTRYWVGISATTTNGSTPFWEVTTDDMIGQPAMYSTGSWFAMYHFSYDGTYIFYAECGPLDPGGGTTDCGSEISNGGFIEGIACNEANSEIAANDIVVPADSNLTLNGIMANMILEEGETITSAKIWIFADEFGYPYMYPGYEVTSQVVTSTSQTLVGSDNGMDFYEVEWDLSPIILEGRSDYTTRYWVGISATTTNGSTPFWEVTTDDMIGQPAMYSTGSWFAMYHFSQDGTYIFYAECEPLDPGGGTNDCGSEIANGGFVEGIACNEANSEIAANDIVVPADSNLTLNGIMANMILEEGETITSAKIWIFADEFGYPYMYPGYEVTSQVVTPTSQTLVGSDNGMDFYEVEWDLSPIILEGRSDYTTRYWVGISATTTNGSTPFWEVTTDDMIGQPAMYSTGSWFAMYHFSQDGTYIFYAECEPLDPGGGTNDC